MAGQWTLPEIDLALCTRCGQCVAQCPTQAVEMQATGPVIVRPADCTYCTTCEAVCPGGAITCAFEITWEVGTMETSVEIHLYGKLRQYAPDPRADRENVVRVTLNIGDTIRVALERAGIAEGEVCHIFLNGALFSTHNSMAPWLGYRQAQENVHQRETDIALKPGDRLGIFGHDMAALVV